MPTPNLSFDLSDLTLYQAHCELRSDPMYLLWDRTGAIWNEMARKMPGLIRVQVNPNEQVFRLNQQYELKVHLERYSLHARRPHRSLKEFNNIQRDFTTAVERNLEVEHYKRVGLRLIYARDFESKADAIQYLANRGLFKPPSDRYFGVDGAVTEAQRILRVEGESNGWLARLYVEEQSFSLAVPLNWEGPSPEETTKVQVILDIDRYEKGLLPIAQLAIEDWIKSAVHAISRDVDRMVRELV